VSIPFLLFFEQGNSPASRHLDQWQLTFDGNYQSNHFAKNCDTADISVFSGYAQFEESQKFVAEIKRMQGQSSSDVAVRRSGFYAYCSLILLG
jgi:hypothetical protein